MCVLFGSVKPTPFFQSDDSIRGWAQPDGGDVLLDDLHDEVGLLGICRRRRRRDRPWGIKSDARMGACPPRPS